MFDETLIKSLGADTVTIVGFKNYIFTYRGGRYSARFSSITGMWTVGALDGLKFTPMVIHGTLHRAVCDALYDVDNFNWAMGEQS